ncbi:MAG: sugar ABC transporter permease [Treponema sp.]|jgi:multiple sugar transport system permease protein|nr:sugar ABC transporter permease [Treponema sp.]
MSRKNGTGILCLLPGLAGFTLFFIGPFCISLVYAFMDRPAGHFVGTANFVSLFHNKAFLRGLINTVRFIGISVPVNIGGSLIVALLIRGIPKRRSLYTLIFLIPFVIPSGSMAFFWKSFFSFNGVLNGLLHTAGLNTINWLDSNLALAVMIMIFIWKNIGYTMVLYLAGLGNIPQEHYEAADIDGASLVQRFLYITLPCLMPVSVAAVIMSIANSFKIFREIYLITGSYPHESIYTLQHFMNNMFLSLNYSRLTAATTVLVIIIAAVTQLLLHVEREKR